MNRTISTTIISCCFVSALLVFSCTKDEGKLPVETPAPTTAPTTTTTTSTTVNECDTITFAKHIKPLVDANCGTATGCHVSPTVSGGVLLVDYAQVKDRAQAGRIKARVFDENPSVMPQSGPLTAAQKKLLNCWLNNGYKP